MPITQARKKANKKYNQANYKLIPVKCRNDSELSKENIQRWACAAGMSVNMYILTAIQEKHQRETNAL